MGATRENKLIPRVDPINFAQQQRKDREQRGREGEGFCLQSLREVRYTRLGCQTSPNRCFDERAASSTAVSSLLRRTNSRFQFCVVCVQRAPTPPSLAAWCSSLGAASDTPSMDFSFTLGMKRAVSPEVYDFQTQTSATRSWRLFTLLRSPQESVVDLCAALPLRSALLAITHSWTSPCGC